MAKPLTKKSKDGETYTRPPEVEANINGAIGQPLDVLRQRLLVVPRADAAYLTSECIVHLLRDAIESEDEERVGVLHTALMKRVHHVLRYHIADGDLPDADEVRNAVIHKLNVLIARRNASMDFYEVRFDRSFRHLYIPVARSAREKAKEHPPAVSLESQGDEPDHGPFMSETVAFKSDFAAAIRTLSPDEREAFTLVDLLGYDVESDDPQKVTAATRCGVTGRTIRDRRARAKKKLAKYLKDDNS